MKFQRTTNISIIILIRAINKFPIKAPATAKAPHIIPRADCAAPVTSAIQLHKAINIAINAIINIIIQNIGQDKIAVFKPYCAAVAAAVADASVPVAAA